MSEERVVETERYQEIECLVGSQSAVLGWGQLGAVRQSQRSLSLIACCHMSWASLLFCLVLKLFLVGVWCRFHTCCLASPGVGEGRVGEKVEEKEQEGMKRGGLQKAGERLCLGEMKALGQLFLNSCRPRNDGMDEGSVPLKN